jgi:tRNA (guanine-N7-)-methyltransferase
MRQRKLKDLDEKLEMFNQGIKINPKALKGHWQDMFAEDQPIYMELGCGKGQFILTLAKAHPERNFIAVEGNRSVMLRALQKASRMFSTDEFAVNESRTEAASGEFDESLWSSDADDCVYEILPNLIFANMYLRDVTDCFAADELSGIYLNFSDPWPKDRHAKRRLTHTGYLKGYRKVLKPGSCLEFKTDNEKLFRFSVDEFEANDLERLEYSENLHGESNGYETEKYMTEYEQKFSSQGNQIYYCKVQFR